MFNVLLVIFGGLALYLFFLSDEPTAVSEGQASTAVEQGNPIGGRLAEIEAEMKAMTLQIKDLKARLTSLESVKQVYADRIKGLQAELENAKQRAPLQMGSDPIFFENKIRREQTAAAPTLQQIEEIQEQVQGLSKQLTQLENEKKQLLQQQAQEKK